MNIKNKFHIDYCFVTKNFKIKSVNFGSLKEWEENKLSDHCPLIVEIEKKSNIDLRLFNNLDCNTALFLL